MEDSKDAAKGTKDGAKLVANTEKKRKAKIVNVKDAKGTKDGGKQVANTEKKTMTKVDREQLIGAKWTLAQNQSVLSDESTLNTCLLSDCKESGYARPNDNCSSTSTAWYQLHARMKNIRSSTYNTNSH